MVISWMHLCQTLPVTIVPSMSGACGVHNQHRIRMLWVHVKRTPNLCKVGCMNFEPCGSRYRSRQCCLAEQSPRSPFQDRWYWRFSILLDDRHTLAFHTVEKTELSSYKKHRSCRRGLWTTKRHDLYSLPELMMHSQSTISSWCRSMLQFVKAVEIEDNCRWLSSMDKCSVDEALTHSSQSIGTVSPVDTF